MDKIAGAMYVTCMAIGGLISHIGENHRFISVAIGAFVLTTSWLTFSATMKNRRSFWE